ncbi:methyltransferase regulatory domain-containing protein [Alloacidobacterium dinghuense]|uniref:Methyltransferase regulatory domain-containing protein n=1 Tax=Alloacidobacterium dinghuense TaxID=2763107 RepID=A0A7G8BID1_9BACT|nr:class I SAM-dependent methyltransferase [Alloacidobacterium dinghuense]QNI32301.1 methyltransferase regulatory domain-containing protein [Alloacidobacterium dinghuense]
MSPQNVYDAVEYPGFPYAHTHPDQLAVMSLLYGLEPAPVAGCRVLEVACNEGANIIPMAYAIPGAEFVGFDLAPECIARGQARVRELGLKNIRIFQADLLKVGPELGEFDYIIAHGLYAWVPEPVRDRLLALCGELLKPNGVAFVSYNALPGSHLRQMFREMMVFRTQGIIDPEEQIKTGIEFIAALAETRKEGDVYKTLFEEHLKRLRVKNWNAVYHDDFSPVYHPVYFSQFIEHAAKHGLQYLTEAELVVPTDPCFRAGFQSVIQSVSADMLAQEQMLDFARMRMYRETLLCRAHHPLKRRFPPDSFHRLRFASSAVSEPGEEASSRFYTLTGGKKFHCTHPATIAIMEKLVAAWPHTLSYDNLMPTLEEHGLTQPDQAAMLLLQLAITQMIELHAWNPPLASGISDRPRATATSRLDTGTRDSTATLWHTQVDLSDPIGRHCLQLLDGTRNRAALLEALKARFPETPVEELEQRMEPNLRFVYRAGLLEG